MARIISIPEQDIKVIGVTYTGNKFIASAKSIISYIKEKSLVPLKLENGKRIELTEDYGTELGVPVKIMRVYCIPSKLLERN